MITSEMIEQAQENALNAVLAEIGNKRHHVTIVSNSGDSVDYHVFTTRDLLRICPEEKQGALECAIKYNERYSVVISDRTLTVNAG